MCGRAETLIISYIDTNYRAVSEPDQKGRVAIKNKSHFDNVQGGLVFTGTQLIVLV